MDVKEEIESDDAEHYSNFPYCQTLESVILENLSMSDQIWELIQYIDELTRTLEVQVLAKHDDLKSDSEANLESIRSEVQKSVRKAERLKEQIYSTPYDDVDEQILINDRLRIILKRLRHSTKLTCKKVDNIRQKFDI